MVEITTVVALLTLVKEAINLAGKLVEKAPSGYRSNLAIVRIDLGIIKDVVKVIHKKRRKELPDSIGEWKEEANKVVTKANELLKNFDKDNGSQTETANCCPLLNKNSRELASLKRRLRPIADRAPAILALLASADTKRCAIL